MGDNTNKDFVGTVQSALSDVIHKDEEIASYKQRIEWLEKENRALREDLKVHAISVQYWRNKAQEKE